MKVKNLLGKKAMVSIAAVALAMTSCLSSIAAETMVSDNSIVSETPKNEDETLEEKTEDQSEMTEEMFKEIYETSLEDDCIEESDDCEIEAVSSIRPSQIVSMANSHVGQTLSSYAGYCLKYVFYVYKQAGASNAKVGSGGACCASVAGNKLITSTSRNIPLGALVFFSGPSKQSSCSCGRKPGHVGIYVGNGVVSARGSGKITCDTVATWESWGYAYRGWEYPVDVNMLSDDSQAPSISNVRISEVSPYGYTVTCTVTDNVGVDKVQFPSWTSNNGQDDLFANWNTNSNASGSRSGNTFTYRVSSSAHNNEFDGYNTHIYAYDTSGNVSCVAAPYVSTLLPSKVDFGTGFTGYIKTGVNTYLTADANENVTSRRYTGANNQKWKFSRYSDGTYEIVNVANGKALDVYGASNEHDENVQTWERNYSDAQKWGIYKHNDTWYYFVPKCTYKNVLDVYSGTSAEGNNMITHGYYGTSNQIFRIEKITETVKLSVSISGCGTVTGAGTYAKGATTTLTAKPSSNYTFAGWYYNGSRISTCSSIKVTINGSTTLTAKFTKNTTCGSSTTTSGTTNGSGTTSNTTSTSTGDKTRDYVLRLYTKALNRQGETAGVNDWTNRIKTKKMSAEDVAKSFFFSQEYYNRHLNNADFVETLYQTFMGRSSDAAGKAYWLEKLSRGVPRTQILEGFSRSQEFYNIMKSFGL